MQNLRDTWVCNFAHTHTHLEYVLIRPPRNRVKLDISGMEVKKFGAVSSWDATTPETVLVSKLTVQLA